MAYFLTIREGTAPDNSYPILATADPEIIELVTRGLTRKLLGGSIPSGISIVKKQPGGKSLAVESGTEKKDL